MPNHQYHISSFKGLAILGVLIIHAFSSFLPNGYTNSPQKYFIVFFDQASRLSVPLFIALSGYTLALKYLTKPFSIFEFYTRRLWKILPAYIISSIAIFFLLQTIPEWSGKIVKINLTELISGAIQVINQINWTTFLSKLITGQIDYQLYFVPLILMFYLSFPIIFYLTKTKPLTILSISIFIQSAFILLITSGLIKHFHPAIAHQDYLQNINPLAWIGYFTLGIFLSINNFHKDKSHSQHKTYHLPKQNCESLFNYNLLFLLIIVFLSLSVLEYFTLVSLGTDPLFARSFHKFSTFIYATTIIIFLIKFPPIFFNHKSSFINHLGSWSYLIFLLHTIAYRIIADNLFQRISITSTLISTLALILTALIIRRFKLG